ncbi:protein CFAP20DC [Gastrophryne carolinensis]
MYKNEYQGGKFVEIFSAQGKDPVAKWKLSGSQSAIWKDFDKEVKSFVFVLEGSSQTVRMQLPKESKQMLGLTQRYLIFQLYIPLGQDFSAELLVTDLANIKRRLYLSTVHKELSATPLHAKIPLTIIRRKVWCNLCIDLVDFTSGIFKEAVFQSLDGIIVSANCRLRKIYTMKLKPQETQQDIFGSELPNCELTDTIPRSCQITTDVEQVTQVLDLARLRYNEAQDYARLGTTGEADCLTSRGQCSSRDTKKADQSHIAFGSKVSGPPPATGRKNSARLSAESTRSTSGHEKSTQQLSLEKGIGPHAADIRALSQKRISLSDQKSKECILQLRTKDIQGLVAGKGYRLCRKRLSKLEKLLHSTEGVFEHKMKQSMMNPIGSSEVNSSHQVDAEKLNNKYIIVNISFSWNGVQAAVTCHVVRINFKDIIHQEDKQTAFMLYYSNSSSVVCSGIEDTLSVRIHMSSCGEGAAQTLSTTSANLTDEWIFPDISQDKGPKLSDTQHQTDIIHSGHQLEAGSRYDTGDPGDETSDKTTTSSSIICTTSQEEFQLSREIVFPDLLNNDGRGAQMEDDFYRSVSSIEEANFQWTSSPKPDLKSRELSQSSHPVDVSNRSSEDPSHLHTLLKASTSNISSTDAKAGDFNSHSQLIPTRSLSPSGSRNEASKGYSVLSKIQQFVSDNKLRTSMSKKSLKEIPKEDRRMTDEASAYDWRLYQINRLSASEMQMLASLKRQQNEELEDRGMSHGLSQSQIDHCNVSMSASSDDTTTWNSSLPPPVNQGSHYQTEMNPLAQSNPRDWLNAFSPPIIPTSQNVDPLLKLKQSSLSSCNEGDDGISVDEEEDILTLLYDPCLNCYFDPETGKYYELA